MNYKLDDVKVIVLLTFKVNLTSCVNKKSSLIWSFKLSRTVTKLFKLYDWVIWLISADILSCKFWYLIVRYDKVALSWTYHVSILLANQTCMFEDWYLCIVWGVKAKMRCYWTYKGSGGGGGGWASDLDVQFLFF